MPVNSCTMARKLVVSVVSTVVGARREARDRFLELLAGGSGGGGGGDFGSAAAEVVVVVVQLTYEEVEGV